MGIGRTAAKSAVPVAVAASPHVAASYVRAVLERAIDGIGPLKPAARAADNRLALAGGDVEATISALISQHVKWAGAQGFVTNIAGIGSIVITIPANVTGIAVLQCHLVAEIAHLRGYRLHDPRVRNAILACLLGPDKVKSLVKKRKLPSSPMALATSPVHDPRLDDRIASEVTSEIFEKVAGRRVALVVARRVPLLGGGVGAATDAMSTYQIGRYAAGELRDRRIPVR